MSAEEKAEKQQSLTTSKEVDTVPGLTMDNCRLDRDKGKREADSRKKSVIEDIRQRQTATEEDMPSSESSEAGSPDSQDDDLPSGTVIQE